MAQNLEHEDIKVTTKLSRVERFIQALGDARDWEFTGDVYDAGPKSFEQCVCGHPIRWVFVIQSTKTGITAKVGSECINHFQDYNPGLFSILTQAHENLLAKIKAEKKAQKEAAEKAAQQEVHQEWEARRTQAAEMVKRYRNNTGKQWVPESLYWLEVLSRQDKPYKTVKGRTKWLGAQVALMEQQIKTCREAFPHVLNF